MGKLKLMEFGLTFKKILAKSQKVIFIKIGLHANSYLVLAE
jgi:hypothetical protein